MSELDPPALTISAHQARLLHLAAQGLLRKPPATAAPGSALAAIERMQLLQIDTIHVVARSPYLVLFSRLGRYPPQWLEELLERGEIFEGWAHEACFVPARDLVLHRAHLELGARAIHWSHKHAIRMQRDQRAGMDALLERVRAGGAVKASDFERSRPAATSGWWNWKDEKRWLEALFALGELMVSRRERFQRVYDLTDRVVARMPASLPFEGDVPRVLILRSVRALGVAQARWIADYFRTGRKHKDADLDVLVAAGDLQRINVRGWDAPGYVHRDHLDSLHLAANGRLRATHTTLLSPFDPVVWDRARASAMFGFDYTIECYTPEHKRRYGYFVLPILHRGNLVGRLDAKAHRSDGIFEVRAFHLEPAVAATSELATQLAPAIQACADWHATPDVVIRRSDPRAFARELRGALKH